MLPRHSLVYSLAWLLLFEMHAPCDAQSDVPFVATFERFGRHREIDEATAGRLLLTELSCIACHAAPEELGKPKAGVDLRSVGLRVQRDWMLAFLSNPSHAKPGSTMPSLLHARDASQAKKEVEALATYLSAQQVAFPELPASGAKPLPHEFWNKGTAEKGRRLFHQVGCVACHEPIAGFEEVVQAPSAIEKLLETLDEDQIVELGLGSSTRPVPSVSFPQLSKKYTLQSLAYFLHDPYSVHASGRMPNLQLTPTEAADVARFLLGEQAIDRIEPVAVDLELKEQGRLLFVKERCAFCHTLPDAVPGPKARSLLETNLKSASGCIGEPASGLPHYAVDPLQRKSIEVALENLSKGASQAREAGIDSLPVSLSMLQFNCLACHQRNQLGGVGRGREKYFPTIGNIDLGDEGRLPPPLTGIGSKATPEWLKKVLQGKGAIRPHMTIRMPQCLPSAVASLVAELKRDEGTSQVLASKGQGAKVEFEIADQGRALFDQGCVQCHPIRGESLPGVVGVDLAEIGQRVESRWFRAFLMNPVQLKARTRMPTFFAPGSVNPRILDGEVDRQIDALWSYLNESHKHPLPDKIEQFRAQSFELKPTDQPIVFRTFMKSSGFQALAVGSPRGIHFAIDTEKIRLAEMWKGRFLDAQSTWYSRSALPIEPLGDAWIARDLPDFVVDRPRKPGDDENDRMLFQGYRLGADGVPEFEYLIEGRRFFDRIEATTEGRLRRTLRSSADTSISPIPCSLRALTGVLTQVGPSSYRNEKGLTVTLEGEHPTQRLRSNGSNSEWRIPLTESTKAWVLEYQW